ncbi:MAG: DUF1302 family protein [Rhodoferax sp.]
MFPGVDMTMPMSWSKNINGNSAVPSGGTVGAGSFSIGVTADINAKHNFALKYAESFGDFNVAVPGTVDRGNLTLTYKTAF